MADFWIKRRDRLPELLATLTDAEGTPADLQDAELVLLWMSPQRHHRWVPATVPGAEVDIIQVGDGSDGSTGRVRYVWDTDDTLEPGGYFAEFEVTWPEERTETFPNDGYFTVAVIEDMEPEGS